MLELIVSPASLDFIKHNTLCDGFIVGEQAFGLRLPVYFSRPELKQISELCLKRNQKLFIAVNAIIHEQDLADLERYLASLIDLEYDALLFGDLAVYEKALNFHLQSKLIYQPETYITNVESAAFFGSLGIKGVFLAKELILDDICWIGKSVNCDTMVLGHGAMNMFHSYRELITNYYRFLKRDNPSQHKNEPLYLVEEIRDDKYPVVEDEKGTHIYSGADLCTVDFLDRLIESNIRYLKLEGLFKSDEILEQIVTIYREALDDYQMSKDLYLSKRDIYIEKLKQIDEIREFNDGFLFKKTVSKGD